MSNQGEQTMTADDLMRLVNRYTEACDDLGSGLFEQTEEQTAAKHSKAADVYGQIQAEVQRLHGDNRVQQRGPEANIEEYLPSDGTERSAFERWYDLRKDGALAPWEVWQAAVRRTQPRKPMDPLDIEEMFDQAAGADEETHVRFARMVEQHHGIGA